VVVVSDSTTLIILYDLQKLEYLKNLFSKVYIPQKVYEEVCFKKDVELPDFIAISKIKDLKLLEELQMLLDDGESEAIAMACEKNLPLIIDEKKGRKVAANLGIEVLGLLGVLYLNVKNGFITKNEAEQFLQKAKINSFRISTKLINEFFLSLKE